MKQLSIFWKSVIVSFLVINAVGWVVAVSQAKKSAAGSRAIVVTNETATASPEVAADAFLANRTQAQPLVAPAPSSSVPAEKKDSAPRPLELSHLDPLVYGLEAPRIELRFTGSVSPVELAKHLAFSPECKFSVRWGYSWNHSFLTVDGDFKPGASYEMTLRKGLHGMDHDAERAVTDDVVRVLDFPDYPASIAFADAGRYLAPNAQTAIIRLKSVNASSVDFTARRLRDQNVFPFLTANSWRDSDEELVNGLLGGPVATNHVVLATPFNEIRTQDIDLRAFLPQGPKAHGTYLVTASSNVGKKKEYDWWREEYYYVDRVSSDSRLVVLSDIGLSVRVEEDHAAVWTTSLSTGKPLGGVKVSLVSRSNDALATAETGADGYVELRYPLDKDDSPLFATASLGSDLTFLSLADAHYNVTPSDPMPKTAREPVRGARYEAFLATPRGIVRPGETLPVKAMVRDLRGSVPASFPIELTLERPDGRVAATRTATLSGIGTAEAEFTFERTWPTGSYTLRAGLPGDDRNLGSVKVSMEEIVPPQIKVSIENLPESDLAPGAWVACDLLSEFLFGAPSAGLRYNGSCLLRATPFAPKGWDGYRFGDAARESKFWKSGSMDSGLLDEEGRSRLQFQIPEVKSVASSLRLVVSATVEQGGGRTVTTYAERDVFPFPFFIGLRPGIDGTVFTGTPTEVAVALVAPDGKAATDASPALKASLERLSHSWNWARDNGGDWHYKVDTVVSPGPDVPPVELVQGAATMTLVFDAPGDYRLRVLDPATDASTTLDFFVASAGDVWEHSGTENPAAIELVPDRKTYAPGDTVTLTAKAPFVGEGMLFLEGAGGEWRHFPITLPETAATVEFPVGDIDVPSLRATLAVLRPVVPESGNSSSKALSVHRAIGTTLLSIVKPERAVAVEVEAPEEILPQSRLSVSAKVLSGEAPAPGVEVAFAAVDEGLCMLTSFKTPDPLAWINAPRWFQPGHYDLFSRLLPMYGEGIVADSHIGGDEGLGKRLSAFGAGKRFRTVALWKGTAVTDAEGRAAADFDVPEFTGKLRVMAIAIGANQYGSAEKHVFVRRPVNVLPSLPRFVAPGDAFDATVEVFNTSPNPVEASLEVLLPGVDSAAESLRLAPGERKVVVRRLTAPSAVGTSTCTVRATLSGAAQPLYAEDIELPIRPAAAYTFGTRDGILKPGESIAAQADPKELVGPELRVVCSRRPECLLNEALDDLIRYPYGCVEQTTSTVFPLLYIRDFAATSRPDLFRDTRCREYVQSGIRNLLAMQRAGGGFAFWSNSQNVYPWGSFYATHFLLEAKKAGYDVPDKALREAVEYAVSLLRQISGDASDGAFQNRAYAVHVAVLGGRVAEARPWLDRLLERRDDIPRAARAHVASALIAAGRPRDAATLLGSKGLLPAADDDSRAFGGSLDSPARDLALLLSAQCDLDPDAPLAADLADALLARRTHANHWYTTQENAMALLALGKYYRAVYKGADEPCQAEVLLPGQSDALTLDLAKDYSWKGGEGTVTIRNTGSAPFHYTVCAAGVPVTPPQGAESARLTVTREFLDVKTGDPIPEKDGVLTLAKGDSVAVRLTLAPGVDNLDQVVVSDLLPAGLEIENPALATSSFAPEWVKKDQERSQKWLCSTDIRDDRILLFSGFLEKRRECTYVYIARAVTPGDYVLPSVTAEAMYDPTVHARNAPGRLVVAP